MADELFTATYGNAGGLIPDVAQGPEAIKLAAALHHTAYPTLRVTIDCLMAEGDMVALRWSARGGP